MLNHTDVFGCPRCNIGRCQPGQITYTRLYNNSLLVLPNTQVFVCDVCGYWEFEEKAIQQIESVEFRAVSKRVTSLSKTSTPERDMVEAPEVSSGQRSKS